MLKFSVKYGTERRKINTLSGGGNSVKLFYPPSEKGIYCKRKEFALRRQFFSFSVDHISGGTWCAGMQTGSNKIYKG